MPDPISLGIGAAAGAAQTVAGIINAAKTKKIAKELEASRPEYEISELAKQDLDLAESEASIGGLSSRAETAYNNLNNQQFSSSLGAILRGGGSVNNVADVFGENEEGRSRLALLSDQMRLSKINNLMKTRDMYREQQDKEVEFNDWRPWADKSQANAAARQQAQNQIWNGIDNVATAGMQYFGGKADEKEWDSLFSGGQQGSQQASSGRQPWQAGQYTPTNYQSGQQGGIYGGPDPYLMGLFPK